MEFTRINRLPPYIFAEIDELKMKARRQGRDTIDLGMGNPDIPTPEHIVKKVIQATQNPKNYRYSSSRGIYKLRLAISSWYKKNYDVDIDPDTETIVTIGVKEGFSHMILSMITSGDVVFVPNPTYPIHTYATVLAGGNVRGIPLSEDRDFFDDLLTATRETWPQPKLIILSFPHNPTTMTVDVRFFEKIIAFAKEHNIFIIHDFAYADLCFDDYRAPSIMQVPGAKDVAVEFFSMSKSYSMPGWRVGFAAGNRQAIHALSRIKSYLDYGIFQPVQIASIIALNGNQDCVSGIAHKYQRRRDTLYSGLSKTGWNIRRPKATMFVWAPIPERYKAMGSLEFSKLLLEKADVAVSPGIGFGDHGEGYIRFALVENEHRIRQAIRGIRKILS
ncbi:MAG: aminotransferase class I/II-fold pyridoxal phosphate-dependent enzyme [Thermodesulfobacteriota bacterium]|nr:aminotransferase class I/II-fold pyridoxal phosphate-dependent enzyme [Thermodesulfobacteriota bacterium]